MGNCCDSSGNPSILLEPSEVARRTQKRNFKTTLSPALAEDTIDYDSCDSTDNTGEQSPLALVTLYMFIIFMTLWNTMTTRLNNDVTINSYLRLRNESKWLKNGKMRYKCQITKE